MPDSRQRWTERDDQLLHDWMEHAEDEPLTIRGAAVVMRQEDFEAPTGANLELAQDNARLTDERVVLRRSRNCWRLVALLAVTASVVLRVVR